MLDRILSCSLFHHSAKTKCQKGTWKHDTFRENKVCASPWPYRRSVVHFVFTFWNSPISQTAYISALFSVKTTRELQPKPQRPSTHALKHLILFTDSLTVSTEFYVEFSNQTFISAFALSAWFWVKAFEPQTCSSYPSLDLTWPLCFVSLYQMSLGWQPPISSLCIVPDLLSVWKYLHATVSPGRRLLHSGRTGGWTAPWWKQFDWRCIAFLVFHNLS